MWRHKDVNNSVSLNAFTSKAATSAVIVMICNFLLTVLLERQYRHFSSLRKFINAFPLFPHNRKRRGLTSGLTYGLASAKSGPA